MQAGSSIYFIMAGVALAIVALGMYRAWFRKKPARQGRANATQHLGAPTTYPERKTSAQFCGQCGAALHDDSRFCHACGAGSAGGIERDFECQEPCEVQRIDTAPTPPQEPAELQQTAGTRSEVNLTHEDRAMAEHEPSSASADRRPELDLGARRAARKRRIRIRRLVAAACIALLALGVGLGVHFGTSGSDGAAPVKQVSTTTTASAPKAQAVSQADRDYVLALSNSAFRVTSIFQDLNGATHIMGAMGAMSQLDTVVSLCDALVEEYAAASTLKPTPLLSDVHEYYAAGMKHFGDGAQQLKEGYLQGNSSLVDQANGEIAAGFADWSQATRLVNELQLQPLHLATATETSASANGIVNIQSEDVSRARLAGGWSHSVVVRSDGTLWLLGGDARAGKYSSNNATAGPLPVGADSRWVAVAATEGFSVAAKDDGTLWGLDWDYLNVEGASVETYGLVLAQLGEDSDWADVTADARGTVFAYTKNGEVFFQVSGEGGPYSLGGDPDWMAYSSIEGSSVGIKRDGSLWSGQSGRLGADSDWAALACGNAHCLALKTDGSLWTWGGNSVGQLGDGTTQDRSEPARVGSDSQWLAIQCGNLHSLALKEDGSLWAWGYNYAGQLGDGSTENHSEPTRVGTDSDWAVIGCGASHCLAMKKDGSLWAWGNNDLGQLGDGTSQDRLEPTRVW